MTDKMTIVYIKKTGHIVGALTRTADPESKPTATALVGTGLILRSPKNLKKVALGNETKTLIVPVEMLDTVVVDLDPDVFGSNLMGFAVDTGGQVVAKLGGNIITTPPDLNTTKIKVTSPSIPAEPVAVWVQLEELTPQPGNEPERRVMEGIIDKNGNNKTTGTNDFVNMPLTIRPNGTTATISSTMKFNVLVLVAGYQPMFTQLSTKQKV